MISSKKLRFSYKTKQIIKDISIQFKKGHLYGILGPNGCGKTTLLKLLSGILRQNYGQVFIDDINLKKFSIREIAKQLSIVNQTNYVEFDYKVSEIIKMGRYAHINRFSGESEEDKKIVNDVITQLGLDDLRDRNFNQLSSGEQQKVIIARAIAQRTKILLLDEPTSHLDINYQLEFMNLFRTYVEKGLIVIVVLHDLNIAAQYCDKILLMNQGGIEVFGEIQKVLTKENVQKVYGIEVAIKKNAYTGSIYITPIRKYPNNLEDPNSIDIQKKKRIHIIAGGGSALNILPRISNYDISVGVLNLLDDDLKLAEELGYKVITEGPFSPISERSYEQLKKVVDEVDLVILVNIPFGKGNIRNLEVLTTTNNKVIIIEENSINERDFTKGEATSIYNQLVLKKNIIVVRSIDKVIESIQKEIGV